MPAPAITAINNASNNRLVTSDGGTTVTAEELLTYDGSKLAAPKAEFSTTAPFTFSSNSATGTYNKTVVYANYNNTSNHAYNGLLFDMGHLTDSGAGEVRKFTIGERGGPTNVIFDQNGIHFGGGSSNPTINSSNGLDEYEEGSWTPTVIRSGSGYSGSYVEQAGVYTRIGRLVHLAFAVDIQSFTGGSGHVGMGGLPFSVGGNGLPGWPHSAHLMSCHLDGSEYAAGVDARSVIFTASNYGYLWNLDDATWDYGNYGRVKFRGQFTYMV